MLLLFCFFAIITTFILTVNLTTINVRASSKYEVGSHIEIGSYNGSKLSWTVIENEGNGYALVLCDTAIVKASFGKSTTYSSSTLRTWLNESTQSQATEKSFYDQVSEDNSQTIVAVDLPDATARTTTAIVNKSGTDHIFLLSREDVFGTNRITYLATASNRNRGNCYWWLRTAPNRDSVYTVAGTEQRDANFGDSNASVVPAMYIMTDDAVPTTGVVTNLSAVIISAIVLVSIICAYFVLDKKSNFLRVKK